MIHLQLSGDLGDGAGSWTIQVEDLELDKLSYQAREELRLVLGPVLGWVLGNPDGVAS
jgi:hypothetical protein